MNKINLNNFGTYIWTSNQLMHCTPAWAYLFNKFWPWRQEVKVLGYEQPNFKLPENFEYISLGKQRGPKYWSNDMKEYFQDCNHEVFYLTTEDGFIVDYVNADILNLAIKIAFINPGNKFLRFNLTADVETRQYELIKTFENCDLIKASQSSNYRQSLQHSIWRKDSFLDKLIPNQTPWDFELDNSRARMDGLDVYATKDKYAIHCGHGYKKGKKVKNWYESINKEFTKCEGLTQSDIEFIEGRNWMKEI